MTECFHGKLLTHIERHGSCACKMLDDHCVVGRVDDDRRVFVILGRSTHHGWSADVDVLNDILMRSRWVSHRLLEWIQVDHDKVDLFDAVLLHLLNMLLEV